MRDADDRIDYQVNKILYHFDRLKYLGGIGRALQALDSEGYLDTTKFLTEKKTTDPSDGRTKTARQKQPTATTTATPMGAITADCIDNLEHN